MRIVFMHLNVGRKMICKIAALNLRCFSNYRGFIHKLYRTYKELILPMISLWHEEQSTTNSL